MSLRLCYLFQSFSSKQTNVRLCSTNKLSFAKEKAGKLRFFVANKYVKYLTNYDKVLEKRFPDAMRVYRVFMDGTKDFFKDVKEYLRIVMFLNTRGNHLNDLKLREIHVYDRMPKDMMKVAPVLLISILPFANYVIFPLAYIFPRHLLCSHFWNIQQRSEFSVITLRNRLIHNRPVFRHLQAQLPTLEGKLKLKWDNVMASLGSGSHPSLDTIISCKELFMGKPFHLFYLKGNHVKQLLLMHDMHRVWFRRSRLTEKAIILQAMDRAIVKEGGVESLSMEALRHACQIRGLNPTNMRSEDMMQWLNTWLVVSKAVDKNCLSLLLHCPILLGYNHPNNWKLIYDYKN